MSVACRDDNAVHLAGSDHGQAGVVDVTGAGSIGIRGRYPSWSRRRVR
jgi:hypothetical protein